MAHRSVAFSFLEADYEKAIEFQRAIGAETLGEAVAKALCLAIGVENQFRKGFTDMIVCNPMTGDFRQLQYLRFMRQPWPQAPS